MAIQSILFFDEKILEIFTDSKYLKDGIESWIYKWKQNDGKHQIKKQLKIKTYGLN